MEQPSNTELHTSVSSNVDVNSKDFYAHRRLTASPGASLPDQNQLYAYYITRCGHHGVRKPNRAVLALLTEDVASRDARLSIEAAERGVAAADLAATESATAAASGAAGVSAMAAVVPLAARRTFCLTEDGHTGLPIYVGARGMLPILDVLAELPLLTEVDFSTVASWYDNDAAAAPGQGGAVTGNDVVFRLCEVLSRLPQLRVLNLRGHPVGCTAVGRLAATLRDMPSVVDVQLETAGLNAHTEQVLRQILDDHRAAERAPANGKENTPAAAYTLPPYIAALPRLDRKTLREQQVLRSMLADDANFAAALTEAQLAEAVLTARVMSTTEAIFRCGRAGIRGDGVHLFLIKSGVLRVHEDLAGSTLSKGDYFGDTYAATLVPCSHLVEEQRGLVYAIPFAACAPLLECWSRRVVAALPWLKRTPLFQSVGAWTVLRACTCAVERTHESAETVVEVGSAACGLDVVCDGLYAALDVRDGDTAQFSERNVRSLFSRFDVFGVEALVARKHTSSVRIKAGKEKDTRYRVLQVRGCAVRLLQQQLRQVFVSLARSYSLHADLCAEETHAAAA